MNEWCDEHYAIDGCWLSKPPKPVPVLPDTVFVAFAVYTVAVQTSNVVSTQPIAGGPMSIFNRPAVTTEERLGVRVVAVTLTRQEAEQAVAGEPAQEGVNYEISEQPLGLKQSKQESAPPVTTHPCIMCGASGQPLNRSFCITCEKTRNEALRSRDMDLINASQP